MDPFFSHYKDQDSPSSANRNVVCRLPTLTLCPDVHCAVRVNVQAISDHRALLSSKSQTIGKEAFPVFSYNHIYFCWRDALEDAPGRGCPDVFGVAVADNGGLLAAAIAHQVIHVALPTGHLRALRTAAGTAGAEAQQQRRRRRRRRWLLATRQGEVGCTCLGSLGVAHPELPGWSSSRTPPSLPPLRGRPQHLLQT